MSEPRRCPQCDAEIPANSPVGLCPRCLLLAANDSQSAAAVVGLGPTKLTPPASGFVPPTVEQLAGQFPQLEILELLGKGGMGAVYKARQRQLDRFVAVKILPSEISHDPAFAERFAREARALAKLNHPHIVAVYDFGQTEANGGRQPPGSVNRQFDQGADAPRSPSDAALCYFVMEYVEGTNLRQVIQRSELKPDEALAIIPQICEALQYAHDEGIVHRDIKPENILIDKRGRVKIADFGLAKLTSLPSPHRGEGLAVRGESDANLTMTGQVMGTLKYMAPEQLEGSRDVDHRADIYSLGVIFYELLTRELPIGRFAPPSKKVAIDVRLDEVVLRALEKEPEQRYQHASEVKSEIETISRTPLPASVARPAQPDPLDAFRHLLRFFTTPQPGYAKWIGRPMLVLLGVWIAAMIAVNVVYGQRDNYREGPILLVQGAGMVLFFLVVPALTLVWIIRHRGSITATPVDDSGRATRPKPVEQRDPLEPFRDVARFSVTPNPSYAKRVGIPTAILFGLGVIAMLYATAVYGQKENYQEGPGLFILMSWATLFWVITIILHILFFARRRASMESAATPSDDSRRAPQPSYGERVGIPMTILFGLFMMAMIAAQSVYGLKEGNDPGHPKVLIISSGAILFWLGVIILHIAYFARWRVSMKAAPTPLADSARAIQPPPPIPQADTDLLPRVTVTVIAGVVGGLTMAAGVALAAFAILTSSPNSGEFWGWMGGAIGCFVGGGGALVGAINSYRSMRRPAEVDQKVKSHSSDRV